MRKLKKEDKMLGLENATESQKEAITTTEGPLLIIAGPGTGKTFTLVERTIYLIAEKGVKPENIMIATFTEKAAKEIITRITNELDKLDLYVNINEMYIGTFHSICLRILKENIEYTNLKKNYRMIDEFEQEYLNKAGKINYFPMKQNIIRGFKKTFYNVEDIYYPNNDDILIHNAQIIIQAVGRICRCRNKNKEIHILTDVDVVDRLQKVQTIIKEGNYNLELTSILDTPITRKEVELAELSKINYNTFCEIRKKAWFVRRSYENVKEWQHIRDYVLRNPTTDNVVDDLKDYYFKFDDKYSGYSYHKNSKQEFDDFNLINKINSQQVSDSDCCLSALLEISEVYKKFEEEKYAMSFKRGNYIMSQSLYQQVYKGALGEVVGKIILENGLGIDLEEIDDYTKYELFDFKHNNIYFDFKHWDDFIIDHNKYCDKIRRKLNRVNGEKCFIINLTVSRSTKYIKQEIQDGIYIIPFLINPDTGEVDLETIEYIDEKI